MARLIAILIALALAGCATPLTEEEREYQHQINRENLAMCEKAYLKAGRAMVSDHGHDRGTKHTNSQIRRDLRVNRCKRVLGKYWAE